MHPVVVDDDAALAALDAAAERLNAGQDEYAEQVAAAESAPVDPNAWRTESRFAASFLAHKVCPNWQVPPDVQEQWAEAVAECANKIMPGGLANMEKWGPWAKLLFASGMWAMVGFDMEKFGFKPLTPPPPAKVVKFQQPAAGQAAGAFTTSTEPEPSQ